MTDPPRSLGLTGAPNARELGGLAAGGPVDGAPIGAGPSGEGRVVRAGLLYRAPGLGLLTDDDVARLDRCRLTTLIDLRHGSEIDVAPPDRLPPGLHVAHIPIFDLAHPIFTYVSALLLGHDLAAYEDLSTAGTRPAMLAVYRWFVTSPDARDAFGEAVRRIADTTGPVLYHCSAGKDRTGWLSAIILSILGADRGTIRADYLLTNEAGATGRAEVLDAVAALGVDPQLIAPALGVEPEYLDEAFAQVDRDYGGMAGYLRDGLALDETTIAELRDRLLTAVE